MEVWVRLRLCILGSSSSKVRWVVLVVVVVEGMVEDRGVGVGWYLIVIWEVMRDETGFLGWVLDATTVIVCYTVIVISLAPGHTTSVVRPIPIRSFVALSCFRFFFPFLVVNNYPVFVFFFR
jgi:hypothetical protein